MKKIISFLFGVFLITLIPTYVHAQENTFVNTYGCNSLYTSDNPDVLADYMVQLIGHQPVKTTLTSYVEELPCSDIDTGRIIFNVCGITGDEHKVCDAWRNEFPKYYSEEFYYEYYSSSLTASRSKNSVSEVQTTEIVQVTETSESSKGFSFNIVHVLISLTILGGLGYIGYNRAMQKSTPSTRED